MLTNLTTQLAREQQRQMLAEASIQQRQRHARLAPATSGTATRIIRSLAAAIAWTSAASPSTRPARVR